MERVFIVLIFTLLTHVGIGQERIVKYYKSNWKEISKNKGEYIREIEIVNDSVFLVEDYIRKGKKLIMKGHFKSCDPFIEHGLMEYYDEYGNEIMRGKYDNGEQIGIWIVKNYQQIEYAELDYNFDIEYQDDSSDSNILTENNTVEGEIVSEKFPEFPGGQRALRNYLIDYTIYPYKCYLKRLNLESIVSFTINKEGAVINPIVTKSSGLVEFDKEIIRMIKGMPKWQAGTQNGKAVDVVYSIPMSFNVAVY